VREKASAVRERRAPAIGEAPTNTPIPAFLQSYLRPLVVAVVAGAFLALIGALGTGDMPLASRLAYWIGLSVLGAVLGTTVAQRHRQAVAGPGLDLVARPGHRRGADPAVHGAGLAGRRPLAADPARRRRPISASPC
jgi:hypothetical protein